MGHQAVQVNDHIDTKQEIQWVIRPTHETYLDQLVGHPLGPPPPEAAFPMISQPLAHQPVLGLPETAPPMVRQPVVSSAWPSSSSVVVPSSPAQLECMLARTLSPQALRYIHLGIQIGQNLLN